MTQIQHYAAASRVRAYPSIEDGADRIVSVTVPTGGAMLLMQIRLDEYSRTSIDSGIDRLATTGLQKGELTLYGPKVQWFQLTPTATGDYVLDPDNPGAVNEFVYNTCVLTPDAITWKSSVKKSNGDSVMLKVPLKHLGIRSVQEREITDVRPTLLEEGSAADQKAVLEHLATNAIPSRTVREYELIYEMNQANLRGRIDRAHQILRLGRLDPESSAWSRYSTGLDSFCLPLQSLFRSETFNHSPTPEDLAQAKAFIQTAFDVGLDQKSSDVGTVANESAFRTLLLTVGPLVGRNTPEAADRAQWLYAVADSAAQRDISDIYTRDVLISRMNFLLDNELQPDCGLLQRLSTKFYNAPDHEAAFIGLTKRCIAAGVLERPLRRNRSLLGEYIAFQHEGGAIALVEGGIPITGDDIQLAQQGNHTRLLAAIEYRQLNERLAAPSAEATEEVAPPARGLQRALPL